MFMFVVVTVYYEETVFMRFHVIEKPREFNLRPFFFALLENGKGFCEANQNWR